LRRHRVVLKGVLNYSTRSMQ